MADALHFKIADTPADFEAIFRLNHRTFAEEIPQHPAAADGRLVDRLHESNVYLVARLGDEVVGMVAVRFGPPFSLSLKLPELDRHLPEGRCWCELRLLAVDRAHRGGRVFAGLVGFLRETLKARGVDAAMISGFVDRVPFYRTLGFHEFGPLVGREGAWFQPMYLLLEDFERALRRRGRFRAISPLPLEPVCLQPGPVTLLPAVREAMAAPLLCHRSEAFGRLFRETREALCRLTDAAMVEVMAGPATLANDIIGAQLLLLEEPGMVVSNGEFGERLAEHARRLWLPHEHLRLPWGKPLETAKLAALLDRHPEVRWLWTPHCETATGHLVDLPALRRLCRDRDIRLAVDCVSSIGIVPVDLSGIWMASASSGKGLGAVAGLAMVFHDDGVHSAPDRLARSLDLGAWAEGDGVAATLPSPLLAALHASLVNVHWHERFADLNRLQGRLLDRLTELGIPRAATTGTFSPGVITLALPWETPATTVADRLESRGVLCYARSHWLRERNWLQFCLMGALTDDHLDRALEVLEDASIWKS